MLGDEAPDLWDVFKQGDAIDDQGVQKDPQEALPNLVV